MDGWRKARESAWTTFGARFWAWWVLPSVLLRLLPAALALLLLGAAGWGLWWLLADPGDGPQVRASVDAGGSWPWAIVGALAVASLGSWATWFARPTATARRLAVALSLTASAVTLLLLVR